MDVYEAQKRLWMLGYATCRKIEQIIEEEGEDFLEEGELEEYQQQKATFTNSLITMLQNKSKAEKKMMDKEYIIQLFEDLKNEMKELGIEMNPLDATCIKDYIEVECEMEEL